MRLDTAAPQLAERSWSGAVCLALRLVLLVALGTFALIYSQSLLTGILVALAALISGAVGYTYSIWRMRKIGGKAGLTPTTA